MARPQKRRDNPLLMLLFILIGAAALAYVLILVWEIPSPAQRDVECAVDSAVFTRQDIPVDALCVPQP